MSGYGWRFTDALIAVLNAFKINKAKKEAAQKSEENKNIAHYREADLSYLLTPSTSRESMVISGANGCMRNLTLKRCLANCSQQAQPVIVLHSGNTELESYIATLPHSIVCNSRHKYFDPIRGFSYANLAEVLQKVAKDQFQTGPKFAKVIKTIYDMQGGQLTYRNLVTCPFDNLTNVIQSRLTQGRITQDQYNRYNAAFLSGQDELDNLEYIVEYLKGKLSSLADDSIAAGKQSVLTAIQNNMIMSLDIGSVTNQTELNFILTSLTLALDQGCSATILLDNVIDIENKQLVQILTNPPSTVNFILSASDVCSLFGGKQDLFCACSGRADKILLFKHVSGENAKKWSEFFGDYERYVLQASRGGSFGGYGYGASDTTTVEQRREFRVHPGQITSLPDQGAFILDGVTSRLMQVDRVI